MWLGPPSSQTMITDLALALRARAGPPARAAPARRRSRSAIVRPPTERPPTLRKLRRENPSQVRPPDCREWKVNIGASSVSWHDDLDVTRFCGAIAPGRRTRWTQGPHTA